MRLFDFQEQALEDTKNFTRVAYYFDMGLGKTFVGAEKLARFDNRVNLVVCPKSKVRDWFDHFTEHYSRGNFIYDLTDKKQFLRFLNIVEERCELVNVIGVINYDLLIRRHELMDLRDFTLMLDESQAIANDKSKRTKFTLKMKPSNVILLSGTPVGGKYEQLYPQLSLLGINMRKGEFWERYIEYREFRPDNLPPFFPAIKIVTGYKNVDALKIRLHRQGARFLKSDEVISLPEQRFETIKVKSTPDYKKFLKTRLVELDDGVLVGDNSFKALLGERLLCGAYNKHKYDVFKDLIESTNDRIIVFYNFNKELTELKRVIGDSRPISEINGHTKDLTAYEEKDDSITLVQFQSGAAGLNLQKANRIIYFSLPLSSALFEQSKKRIHRIGQSNRCFYYTLTVEDSIEEKIQETLDERRDFTDKLFEAIDR